ncbi:unnamed protein product [Discosporangium mesarthrocarpum]
MPTGALRLTCSVLALSMAGGLSAPASSRSTVFSSVPGTVVSPSTYCSLPTRQVDSTNWGIRPRLAGVWERKQPLMRALAVSGGGSAPSMSSESGFGVASTWGVLCVISILLNAVKRLAPIALEPFKAGDFTHGQWAMYAGFALFMAYAEGFKGFQKKFSPLVVKRALTLDSRSSRPGPLRILLAGPYCMGLFHATRKRKVVGWCLTAGVFGLVQVVKRLSYPWRSIVDAGVVVGLSYGALSIGFLWARAILGTAPDIDPALPKPPQKA